MDNQEVFNQDLSKETAQGAVFVIKLLFLIQPAWEVIDIFMNEYAAGNRSGS